MQKPSRSQVRGKALATRFRFDDLSRQVPTQTTWVGGSAHRHHVDSYQGLQPIRQALLQEGMQACSDRIDKPPVRGFTFSVIMLVASEVACMTSFYTS